MTIAHSTKAKNTKLLSSWTPLAARLEAEGQWQELTSLLEESKRTDWQSLTTRWQAALGRAAVFSGQIKLARDITNQLSASAYGCMESRVILLLTQAALERRQQRWAEARKLAAEARQIAEKQKLIQLEMDARFAEAVSFAEEGRIFLAIDLFQSIRSETRPISRYRKELAALNEAWCLWDLGQRNLLQPLLPHVPRPYRTKIEVYIAILENKTGALQHWVNNGFGTVEIFPVDLAQILLVLTEWFHLQNPSPHSIKKSWLYTELKKHNQDPDALNTKLAFCLSLLLEDSFPKLSKISQQTDPVTHIEIKFLWILSLLKKSPHKALLYYKKQLMPLMQKHRLCTPLIPQWADLETPFSPWARLVARALGLSKTQTKSVLNPAHGTLHLQNGKLFLESSSQFLDLRSSPIADALLKNMHGRKGQCFQKADLHYALNKTSYRPHLHDARLHKLIKRLAIKIEQSLQITPWNMPGDNSVVLCCNIEVSS